MALAKRIIPCLDVDQGAWLRASISSAFVMQVTLLRSRVATRRWRRRNHLSRYNSKPRAADTTYRTVEQIASEVFIPLTVGGGVRAVSDIRTLLNAGADKVSINTAAIFNPELVKKLPIDLARSASLWPWM